MTLYSYQGNYPSELPFRIRLSDGMTRTDPSTFTIEEIADSGYINVDDAPSYDANTQHLVWNSELVQWQVINKTQDELNAEAAVEKMKLIVSINNYRDELISNGFLFNNTRFDSRPEDQKRISGAALLAFMAITQGAQQGDVYWHGGSEPFSWIAQDNSIVEMDAYTVVEFGKTAAEHERMHIFAARTLKDMDPIPSDWKNMSYW